MKKLIGILAVGCLFLFGSGAVAVAITITPYTYNLGTTEWTTTTAAVGSSSLQLNDPGNVVNYAGIRVTNLGDPKVKDFDGWSYWTKGPQFHGVNFVMMLDTPGIANVTLGGVDQGYDAMLSIMPYNTLFYEGGNSAQQIPGDTWVNLNSETRYPYQLAGWDSAGNYLGANDIATQSNAITWSEFQAMAPFFAHVDWGTWDYTYDLKEATVLRIAMRMGGGGHVSDNTGYLDDFTLDGIPIWVEGGTFTVVPEPATMLLLGSGLIGLAGFARKRFKK